MNYSKETAIKQIESALRLYESKCGSSCNLLAYINKADEQEIAMRLFTTVERLSPSESSYEAELGEIYGNYGLESDSIPLLVGVIKSLKADIENDFLYTFEELIHADIFEDFLHMAEYLLTEGYKDPAAVIIGGVLEEHLRKLCSKGNISIEESGKPIKADRMNAELYKANIYSKTNYKQVTAWLDIRNNAAHGKYDEYSADQVELMLQGCRNFISSSPV